MATVSPTVTQVTHFAHTAVWPSMANGDVGEAYVTPDFPDKTIQITGTFGAGGTVVLEGSLDGTNYQVLTDFTGASISLTSAALLGVTENVLYMRPRVSGGDGTTSLTVTVLTRRDQ